MRFGLRQWRSSAAIAALVTLVASAVLSARVPVELRTIGVLTLAVAAEWLAIRPGPSGRTTLLPLVVFASLLQGDPVLALVSVPVGVFGASLVNSREFSWRVAERGGEAGTPALAAFAAFIWVGGSMDGTAVPGFIAAGAYVISAVMIAWIRARAVHGMSTRSFVRSSGAILLTHLTSCAALAIGLSVLRAYVGFMGILFGTLAILEIYYPAKLLSDQDDLLYGSLAMIAQAIDLKDPYTARHSQNVARYAVRIARAMDLPESEVARIRIGALLHDIGKIGVSGQIIRKPSSLDAREQVVMRSHPEVSADILAPIDLLGEAAEMVRHHHEHFDGSGYPTGLRGDDIPISSRIILVADAFDAMTTDRPYRRGRPKGEALKSLKEHSGRQFDYKVVEALESIIDLI